MELLRRLPQHLARTAVIYGDKRFSYETLLVSSEQYSAELIKQLSPQQRSSSSEHPPRIGLYAAPGPEYVAATWAIWQCGGICVPLATSHPPKELSYFFQDAGLSAVLTPPEHAAKLQRVAYEAGSVLQLLPPPMGEDLSDSPLSWGDDAGGWRDERDRRDAAAVAPDRAASGAASSSSSVRHSDDGALIIYTSGTTGRPKGVVHTVRSLQAQIDSLVTAWEWRQDDRILHTLPLHHIHGVVNALYCAHHCGAAVHFLPRFSPSAVWRNLRAGHTSVLMAVPTMYNYLLAHHDAMESEEHRDAARRGAAALRLTVSGSAACPLSIISRWKKLTGQTLLERYGMTETGMILSNPYRGERRPGTVGLPLPGVQVKIAEDGEVRVKSESMFKEYWNSPHATTLAFDEDGWFHTGDTGDLFVPRTAATQQQGITPPTARVGGENDGGIGSRQKGDDDDDGDDGLKGTSPGPEPYYAILGRTSVDIIKSGGYKISALDIENVLLDHPGVSEVAVVGMPDETLGEVIWAILVAAPGASEPGASELRDLCRDRLAPYQMPRVYRFVDELPRNAMGKLNKKELVKQLHDDL